MHNAKILRSPVGEFAPMNQPMQRMLITIGIALLGLSAATETFADTWIIAYAGKMAEGSTVNELLEPADNDSNMTYGLGIGSMINGIFGGELDVGHAPNVFGIDSLGAVSRVTTVQGSLLLGIPIGGETGLGFRPYAVTGIGMVRRHIEFNDFFDDITTSDFGYNVGVGVMGFITNVIGIRGEFRHFRNFQKSDGLFPLDEGTFSFSRGTVGVVFRF